MFSAKLLIFLHKTAKTLVKYHYSITKNYFALYFVTF